jgi:hypothetical protein
MEYMLQTNTEAELTDIKAWPALLTIPPKVVRKQNKLEQHVPPSNNNNACRCKACLALSCQHCWACRHGYACFQTVSDAVFIVTHANTLYSISRLARSHKHTYIIVPSDVFSCSYRRKGIAQSILSTRLDVCIQCQWSSDGIVGPQWSLLQVCRNCRRTMLQVLGQGGRCWL